MGASGIEGEGACISNKGNMEEDLTQKELEFKEPKKTTAQRQE